MSTVVQHKRSSTTGNVPTLSEGQIGVNLVDRRVFTANTTVVFDAFGNTVNDIAITNSTSGALRVGNSTVNAIVNSTSHSFANSTVTFTLAKPTAADYAAATKFLAANGSFLTPTAVAAAGGANTNVQYNDSTAINGSAGFTFDKTTNNVTMANTLSIGANVIANTTAMFVGNSTVNVIQTSISLNISNTTVNSLMRSTSLQIANSTVNTWIDDHSIAIGNSTLAQTTIAVSLANSISNSVLTPISLTFGDATRVSTVVNSAYVSVTGVALAMSQSVYLM